MGHCMFLRKGETHTVPLSGILASDIAVGSTVKLMENGVAVEYLVVNQGIPGGSSLYDASCDGTWVLRKDCHSKRTWDSTDNDYENSDIHAWLNGDFFNSFSSIEQTAIKQVKIPYRPGASAYSTTIKSGENGLSTKVFLVGCKELNISNTSRYPVDGYCLDYFQGTVTTDSKRIALYSGSACSWFMRTPYIDSDYGRATMVSQVTSTGWYGETWATTDANGIRPAMILQPTALFDKNTLILKGVA